MTRVLVADDEPQLRMILEYVLRGQGFDVETAAHGADAFTVFRNDPGAFDVVILDVTMPRMSGVEVCRRIREISDVPVIMLTARTQTEHLLAGFDAGVDDYVTKPFEPDVLVARISAVLRRYRPAAAAADDDQKIDGMDFDDRSHTVHFPDRSVTLSDVEWRLLRALTDRAGEVLSWRLLLTLAWDAQDHSGGRELTKASIYRLRQRLGDHGGKIETVRGGGYRWIV